MKKILCLILCLVLVFSLSACGKDSAKTEKHSVDVEYYAKLGQISELEYKLGGDIEDAKALLHETLDDHGDPNFFEYESGEYTIMTDGGVCVCYKTDDKKAGITHIVKYGDAYGFISGDVSVQIRDTMTSLGYEATEKDASKDTVFFMPVGADMTTLEYKIKENTVLFIFQEHALSATVISK